MAHPPILVEYAVRQFIQHWYLGLQPSLNLTTLPMGDVSVSLNVSSLLSNKYQRHKSGRKSRLDRRSRRSEGKSLLTNTNEVLECASQPENEEVLDATRTTIKYPSISSHQTTESSKQYQNQPSNSHPSKSSQMNVCPQPDDYSVDAACQTSSEMDPVSIAVQAVCGTVDVACETASDPPSVKRPILSVDRCSPISIPPREIYHPAVINACLAICDKHPSQVTNEEAKKFKFYLEQKRNMGQPVESDLIYLPISMRNCLHSGHLT